MIDRDDDSDLDALVAALRAETRDAPASTVASTRARIIATARKRKERGSPYLLAAAAALAVVLGGSTVWAWFTGRIAFPWAGDEAATAREAARETERARRDGSRAGGDVTAAPQETAGGDVTTAPQETAVDAVRDTVQPTERGAVPELRERAPELDRSAPEMPAEAERPSERSHERAPRPIDPAERRAYDAAHVLHFDRGDWPAAIAAWDAYLASFPRGRFRLEARYNRAIALVRAGRTAEARQALAPFAAGRFGEYRRTEAQALLEALAPEPAQ